VSFNNYFCGCYLVVSELTAFLTSGPVTAIELQAKNAIERWKDMAGPTDPAAARETAPSSLRASFGTGK